MVARKLAGAVGVTGDVALSKVTHGTLAVAPTVNESGLLTDRLCVRNSESVILKLLEAGDAVKLSPFTTSVTGTVIVALPDGVMVNVPLCVPGGALVASSVTVISVSPLAVKVPLLGLLNNQKPPEVVPTPVEYEIAAPVFVTFRICVVVDPAFNVALMEVGLTVV
jgi:hypothetical protein